MTERRGRPSILPFGFVLVVVASKLSLPEANIGEWLPSLSQEGQGRDESPNFASEILLHDPNASLMILVLLQDPKR
jgi:hypothetical protein